MKGRLRYQLCCAVVVCNCFIGLLPQAMAQQKTVAFNNVNIVHPKDGSVTEFQRLIVVGGRIRDIGAMKETPVPAGAQVVPANGWYVMPGLYEMHAHVPPASAGEQRLNDTLRLYLANGITTIRGMLGEPGHLKLRAALRDGQRIGPRLITSGPSFNGRSVSSAKQAEQMVREQAGAGYDFLKLHPGLGPMEFDALVRAAKAVKIPFAGHVSVDVGLTRVLRAEQATIDHLDGYAQQLIPPDSPLRTRDPGFFGIAIAAGMVLDRVDQLAQQTARAGVWNVPTQSLMENILGETSIDALLQRPEMAYVDRATKAQWKNSVSSLRQEYRLDERRRFLQIRRALIAALQESGGGLLLGSDAPQIMNVPGFSIHQELALMVQAGLVPQQALMTGTSNPAEFFGEARERGWIAPGYVADLVFLAQNPLNDIGSTREVLGVYHNAHWYDREQLDTWLADIRTRLAE